MSESVIEESLLANPLTFPRVSHTQCVPIPDVSSTFSFPALIDLGFCNSDLFFPNAPIDQQIELLRDVNVEFGFGY